MSIVVCCGKKGKALKAKADWQRLLSNFLELCAPAGSSGRTCRGAYPQKISEPGSSTSTFFFQHLQKGGILCAGEFWTLNLSEFTDTLTPFLSEDVVSSLSDILEPNGNIQPRYFLSRKCCLGITRRAEKRGQPLPEILRVALEQQAARGMEAE